MEIVEMNLFNESSGEAESRTVNFSECLNHEIQSQSVVTKLDDSICGQYDTFLNKALSMSFKLKEYLGEEFYIDEGFYDINKLTPEIEELQAMVYYNTLACTIIKEMYDYIVNDKKLVFSFDFEDTPIYVSPKELMRVIVYKLRTRKFNAVKSIGRGEYYIYVNSVKEKEDTTLNNVTDGAGYLKNIVFEDMDLEGLPMVTIRVSEFTKLIGMQTFNDIYTNVLDELPNAKLLMKDLIEACNLLNDTQYKDINLLRAKQLNDVLLLLFESVIRFTGANECKEKNEENNLEYLNVNNEAKELCNICIDNGLDFSRYVPLCDIVGKVILFTDDFKEQPEELSDEDFKLINRKINKDLAEMYKDFCRMFIKNGKINVFSPIGSYNIW